MPDLDVPEYADRLTELHALRRMLWGSIGLADPEKRAPLAARLESVVEQIERLTPSAKEGDAFDEIAARRASRGAVPAARKTRSS